MCDDSIADPAVNITGCAVCEVLVGLENVEVLKAESCDNGLLRVHISSKPPRPKCHSCGGNLWSHGKRSVSLVDLCVFVGLGVLVWYKQRWKCSNENCEVGTFTEQKSPDSTPTGTADNTSSTLVYTPSRHGAFRQRNSFRTGL